MSSPGDEESEVLSDVEEDDPVPIVLTNNPTKEEISVEKYRELVAELEKERQAREAAEKSKAELQGPFNRLKQLVHEAIKKRDECARQRDGALLEKEEALRSNERLAGELSEVSKLKDEVVKERDDIARQLEEMVRSRDSLRSEIEAASQLLVSGVEKISGKVSHYKNFSAGGLPRSQKYSGVPAVAYGIIKRTNEIVEELLKQIDTAEKSRNNAREQVEQRNYEIAIEVSELEATISGLREEVAAKISEVEQFGKMVIEKDAKISEMDREMLEKHDSAEKEISELRQFVDEYSHKLKSLEAKMDSQRPLLNDQLNYLSRIHEQIHRIIMVTGAHQSDQPEDLESMVLSQDMDMNENLRASLTVMESIYEMAKTAVESVRDKMEERICEAKDLNETVARLVKEKQHIGSLLRSAISKKMTLTPSSKTTEVLEAAENGLREAGIEVKLSNLSGTDTQHLEEMEEDEVFTLAGALENIVKGSQLEIIELQHSVEQLRTESSLLKAHVDAQAKELNQRKHRIEELEEKEKLANENIEGLMMDIAAAEEEIARWKLAAEQEAAAGKAVEQEFVAQLSDLRQEVDEAKQAVLESEKKLKFKEETATAAMAARDAAEKSLRLADLRATRLRERLEELSHQLEESDTREDSRRIQNRQRYMCWPWQWLGLNIVGHHQAELQQQNSTNEMELSEPLL